MNITRKERKLWKKWVKTRYKLAKGKTTPENEEKRFFEWKRVFVQNINNKF